MQKPFGWVDRINPPPSKCDGCPYESDCYEISVFYRFDHPCFIEEEINPKEWLEVELREREEEEE